MAENVLDRNFTATTLNQVWTGDITYVRTWEGWLYLAVIIDLYSWRVGWALADQLRQDLVARALHMALGLRQPGTILEIGSLAYVFSLLWRGSIWARSRDILG